MSLLRLARTPLDSTRVTLASQCLFFTELFVESTSSIQSSTLCSLEQTWTPTSLSLKRKRDLPTFTLKLKSFSTAKSTTPSTNLHWETKPNLHGKNLTGLVELFGKNARLRELANLVIDLWSPTNNGHLHPSRSYRLKTDLALKVSVRKPCSYLPVALPCSFVSVARIPLNEDFQNVVVPFLFGPCQNRKGVFFEESGFWNWVGSIESGLTITYSLP